MTEQDLRFTLGALLDLMEPALTDGEDIDAETVLQTLQATGLAQVHPEAGLVLSDFARQCLAEFLHELHDRQP
jgi:hypothetical protein